MCVDARPSLAVKGLRVQGNNDVCWSVQQRAHAQPHMAGCEVPSESQHMCVVVHMPDDLESAHISG